MTSAVTSRVSISGICQRAASAALALAVVLAPAVVATRSARAQTFSVLFRFPATGTDGANPNAGLIRDASGNLYGTAGGGAYGLGTVFKLDTTGKETVLHSFVGYPTDGFGPSDLIRDASGNLYGTTFEGGAGSCGLIRMPVGCGTVFKLNTTGNETVLYGFGIGFHGVNLATGIIPYAGLVLDASGNLYGTTGGGGAFRDGVVFKLDATGRETVLHSFTGADGRLPYARLVLDASGNLYGTTLTGGAHGLGTVFKLDTTGKETVLHSFSGPDGQNPQAGLVLDASGNLYSTTSTGGAHGLGTVFKLDTTGKETVLHSFSGPDGENPQAGLVRDASGNLYGTTYSGGAHGLGTVFKLDSTGTETVLHSFSGPDGQNPAAVLIRDASGTLYGTTVAGGNDCSLPNSSYGSCGTVFKLQ